MKLTVTKPVSNLSVQLNGHALALPAARVGRLRVPLDAKAGLELGENLLWVTAGRRNGRPRWEVPVRFVVGYRDARRLRVRLRLGAGTRPAAMATVRAPRTSVLHLGAWLNGRRVPVRADVGSTRRRVLNLAQLGRPHWGANRLRVRLVMMDGRVGEQVRTFRLDRRRSIAVAQVRGRATVGHNAVLQSGGSRVRGTRDVRWKLLRRPKRSHVQLGIPRAARTTLRPDVPGDYLVALSVSRGARRGYDLLHVSATDDNPLVPLDTIAYSNSSQGVKVGDAFYKEGDADIQVVVLHRADLSFYANFSYQATTSGYDDMAKFLGGLNDTMLVIVTYGGLPLPTDGLDHLDTALRAIGGTVAARWTFGDAACWSGATDSCTSTWQRGTLDNHSFSVVGVPGLPAGQAWRANAAQTGTTDGDIRGYFTTGTLSDSGGTAGYTLVNGGADHYTLLDTCSGSTCGVQIGDQLYQPTPGASGIHVVAVDRTTLAPILNRTVTTTANLVAALTTSGSSGLVGHFVPSTGMDDQRLVILQSVGTGRVSGTPTAQLMQYIDELGGTPELIVDAVDNAGHYALVGAATDLPWRNDAALESSTAMQVSLPPANGEPTGRIAGALERQRDGQYAPLAGDPVQVSNLDLLRILYQPPTPWPDAGDPALKYIADNIGLKAYEDVRSAYYLQTELDWDEEARELTLLTCTGADQSVCGPNFSAVKGQLLTEFGWVPKV